MATADFDAIVIGSGHHGLICALRLADAGWKVLVLERSSEIGGAIRTVERVHPGFRHDLYAINLSLFTSSLVYQTYRAEFERDGLGLIRPDEPFASAFPDGRSVRIYRDAARTEAEFAQYSPQDAEGWRRVVNLFKTLAPQTLPVTNMPLPSRSAAAQLARMALHLRFDLRHLRHAIFGSAGAFAERYFTTEETRGVFTPWAFHLDFAPDITGGAAFAFVSAVSAHLGGLVLARGGSGNVVHALECMLERRGVVIRRAAEVAAILVENGRAIGVRTVAGDEMRAGRAVIANVTPRALFGRLVPESALPAEFHRRALDYRYGPGVFMVHLALARPLEWRGGDDLAKFMYVHLNGRPAEIAKTYRQCMAGQLPERPMMVVAQPSHADPSRAPPGGAAVRIQVRAVPARIAGDAAGQIAGREWDAIKEAFCERVIDQLVEHAPNLRAVRLAQSIMSPLDFERENPNLIGGDCVSGSHHPAQNYFSRPLRGWSRYRTPIDRLYMAGAFCWPGGGVNGAAGFLLAQDLTR